MRAKMSAKATLVRISWVVVACGEAVIRPCKEVETQLVPVSRTVSRLGAPCLLERTMGC